MNDLYFVPVTERLLCEILASPWSVTEQELAAWGGDPRSLLQYLHENADIQAAISTSGEGIPVCAFGGQKTYNKPEEAATWFVAGRLFPAVGLQATRMIRRQMRQMAKEIGVTRVVTVSGSEHEDVDKWFRVLGYKIEEAEVRPDGAMRRYVMNL